MANEDAKGAFTQMDSAARVPSKLGALSSNFYGTDPSLGQSMGDVVRELMPTAADKERSSSMAFWGGFGAPNTSGSLSGQLGNATAAQGARELEGERLKASYVPMITQAMLANQTQTLAGNKQVSDLAAAAAPHMNAALASLGTSGAKPTRSEAIDKAIATGKSLNLPLSMVQPYIDALPKNDEDISKHIGQLGQGLNASGFGNQPTTNAMGQTVFTNAGRGTVSNVNSVPGQQSANPSTREAQTDVASAGDLKGYGTQLEEQSNASTALVRNLNEINKNLSSFTPGHFAEKAGEISAFVKDGLSRIPGIDKAQVEKLTSTIQNAPEGSKESLAAMQMAKQLLSMQTISSAREAVGPNSKLSVPEFKGVGAAGLSTLSDPDTFKKFTEFHKAGADLDLERLGKYNEYLDNPNNPKKSSRDFVYNFNKGRISDMDKAVAAEAKAKPEAKAETVTPKAEAIKPEVKATKTLPVDLKDYPAGTKLTASGRAFVTNPDGSHSYVKPIK